jgi:hypothetical protein
VRLHPKTRRCNINRRDGIFINFVSYRQT